MTTTTQEEAVDSTPNKRKPETWHVGREIPIALILVVLIQTGGGIWWASAMSSKLDSALKTLDEFKAERYTKEDGRRDREFLTLTIEALRNRDSDLERRMTTVERVHEAMGSKAK